MSYPFSAAKQQAAKDALSTYIDNYRLNIPKPTGVNQIVSGIANLDPRGPTQPYDPNAVTTNLNSTNGWGLDLNQVQSVTDTVMAALG